MHLLIQLLSTEADTRRSHSSHSDETLARTNVDGFLEALEEGALLDSSEEKVLGENLSALAAPVLDHRTRKTEISKTQTLDVSLSERVGKAEHPTHGIARLKEDPSGLSEIAPKVWPSEVLQAAGNMTERVQVGQSPPEDAATVETGPSTAEWELPKVTGEQAPKRQDQNIATPERESYSTSEVEAKGNVGGIEARRAPLIDRSDEHPNDTGSAHKTGVEVGFAAPVATGAPTDKTVALFSHADRSALQINAGGQRGSATVEIPNRQVKPSETFLKSASTPDRSISSGVPGSLSDGAIGQPRPPQHPVQNEKLVDRRKTREFVPPEDVAAIKEVRSPVVGLATSGSGGPLDVTQPTIPLALAVPSARLDALGHERMTLHDMIAEVQQSPLGPTDRVDAGFRGAFAEGVRGEHMNTRSVVTQVVQSAMRVSGEGSVEVRLHPEELGRVRLTLLPSETGVSVQITAERTETLELLRRNIDMLESDLRRQGFTGTSFSFGSENSDHAETSADDDAAPNDASNAPARQTNLEVELSDGRTDVDDGRLDIRV